ncbi:hypothetical protein [Oceanicola sp. 502str15]|uniref:hypothetical protein n=1 Tax=Oceanicola sp. 502str15 TaxID=2696061 RepID=UPI002095AE8A|nr:hypothetical protein [Oceanicola sp. 502str15]MCO6385192.1 hypothetical protein [Oceanicola sp. 502str15]
MNIFAPNLAIHHAKGPTIMLASGRRFDLLDPSSSTFGIDDIAHGLANVCRYAGQCRGFYSVAEHSLLVSQTVSRYAFEALLHDSAEAFIGDITRPLKKLLPDYREIEERIEDAVAERFGLDRAAKATIKEADLRVLAAEQQQVMALGCADWSSEAGILPAPVTVRGLSPNDARAAFLRRYEELRPI